MVGVDLGGTNVRAAVVLSDGKIVGPRIENPSRAQDGAEATLDAIAETVAQACAGVDPRPEAVGIAIPGRVDDDAGIVVWSPNFGDSRSGVFHFWTNVPFREPLSRRIDLPMHMGNDANLAALGEYVFGSGRNSANCLVMFTVGTGIGSGVVLGPQAVYGKARGPMMLLGGNKGGVEIGHTVIQHGGLDCSAGSYGSIEGYCQKDSIVQRAQHRLVRGRPSILRDWVAGDLSKITPKLLADAADQGDELAIEVWEEVGTYLGVGIGNAISIFAPDIVAVGGQIAKAGEWLLGPARKAARNTATSALFPDARIVQAEQIEDAGLLGGAALALGLLDEPC